MSFGVNYVDCGEAFNAVPHKELMRKLEAREVPGKILQWIRAFLNGKEQFVKMRGDVSIKLKGNLWSTAVLNFVYVPVSYLY